MSESMTLAQFKNLPSATGKKYGNRKTEVDGTKFDSAKEANRFGELKILARKAEVFELVLQHKFPLVVNGKLVCTYVADFVYKNGEGFLIVEDVKGFKTEVYKIKKKLMIAVYGIDILET